MGKKGKKGGGKGGSGKKGAKVGGWQPVDVPLTPMREVNPTEEPMAIAVRGRAWSLMDFNTRVPALCKVGELIKLVALRQGGTIGSNSLSRDFQLHSRSTVSKDTLLNDPERPVHEIDFEIDSTGRRIIIYEYLPSGFWHSIAARVVASPRRPSSAPLGRRRVFAEPEPELEAESPPRWFPQTSFGNISNKVSPMTNLDVVKIIRPASAYSPPYRAVRPGGA